MYTIDGNKIYCKDFDADLEALRNLLIEKKEIIVSNQYETFYGVSFDYKMRAKLSDLDCDIEVTSWNKWEGYPWSYRITIK